MILIKGAEVYSPKYIGKKDILIAGEKIQWVRDEINLEDEEIKVISGEGQILLPGLIDQHIHITGGGGEGSFRTKAPEVQLSELIKGGITTVIGLLGTDGISRSVENLLAKAKALKEEGISCYVCTGSYGYPSVTLTGNVEKDIAFIDEVLGVKLAISDHRASNVTVEELIRLASDVRRAGMLSGKPGIVVLHMGDDPRGLKPVREALKRTSIPIKTFRPTHVNRNESLFKEALDFAKEGGYIDITVGEASRKSIAQCLYEAKEKGISPSRITFSSDGQGSWSNYDEKGNLIEIGVSSVKTLFEQIQILVKKDNMPLENILIHATSAVADALELFNKGRIKEGADADILLCNKNLELQSVIAQGEIMMLDGELKRKGTYEK